MLRKQYLQRQQLFLHIQFHNSKDFQVISMFWTGIPDSTKTIGVTAPVNLELNILNVLDEYTELIRTFCLHCIKLIHMVIYFSRHGEKCAGVIAAVLNNSYCGVGLAYNARLGGTELRLSKRQSLTTLRTILTRTIALYELIITILQHCFTHLLQCGVITRLLYVCKTG